MIPPETIARETPEIKPIERKPGPITLAEFSDAMFGFTPFRLRERERMRRIIEQKDMKR